MDTQINERVENTETGQRNYNQMVFDKGKKATQWRKNSLSKTLLGKIRENLGDLGLDEEFLDMMLKALSLK